MSLANQHLFMYCALLLSAFSGCGGPDALPLPSYDPPGSAAKAMELYDTDGDGFVAGEELEKAPGLKAALKNLDSDGDGKVSEEEVAERLRAWEEMKIGMMPFRCEVSLDGKLVDEATVTFEPDAFLQGRIEAASGITGMTGTADPKVPKENRPTPDSPPGMQAGIYTVRISKKVNGVEKIPSKYNESTVLGQEVSNSDAAVKAGRARYQLQSK